MANRSDVYHPGQVGRLLGKNARRPWTGCLDAAAEKTRPDLLAEKTEIMIDMSVHTHLCVTLL